MSTNFNNNNKIVMHFRKYSTETLQILHYQENQNITIEKRNLRPILTY